VLHNAANNGKFPAVKGRFMRRRHFITLVGGAAAAWPLAAAAQHIDPMRRIGVLVAYAEGDPEMQARLVAFRRGLEQLGWFEGRNIRFDIRFAPAGTGQEHSASLAATFEGEFSDVTRSYAGKGVARYSR
jgi:hypothetical protein